MLNLRSTNPLRPVDWRWQRARLISDNGRKGSRQCDDKLTSRAITFARRLANCHTERQQYELLDSDPDFYEAWNVYKQDLFPTFHWELAARVMADEPAAEIARKTGISTKIIEIYEACFFDVRDKLDSQSYLRQCVLQPSAAAGLKNREYDLLWKLYGYWGGPNVLDSLIYGISPPSKPDNAAGVAAFWRDDIADSLGRKAAMAMRNMQVDSQTHVEILGLFQKMVELERNAGEGKGANESILMNINAMLGELPWHKYQRTSAVVTDIDKLDAAGVNLRASELMIAGLSGGLPPGLQTVLMSEKFPEEPPSRLAY